MVRPFLRARAIFLSAMLGALFAPAARSADLDYPADPAPVEGPVEWGSGWYLRGDVGWQHVNVPAIAGDIANNFNNSTLASGGLGAGYQFNDWFRADVTIDRSVFRANGPVGQLWCPYAVIGLIDPITQLPAGILGNPADTCTKVAKATLNRTSVLANGYLDLGHWWGFTPYVGAGVGVNYNQADASLLYYRNSDGGLWAPDLTLPGGQVPRWIYVDGTTFPIQLPFGPTNWNTAQQKKTWQFAWNLMAGVAYDVSDNLKVDLGYRYLNAGRYTSLPSFGGFAGVTTKDITSHEVRVGFRLVAN